MAYCTYEDLLTHFPRLRSLGTQSKDEVEAGTIPHVSSWLDARIGRFYRLPFADPIPPLLKAAAVYLTLFDLLSPTPGDVPPWLEQRVKRIESWLDGLIDGTTVLVNVDGSIVPTRTDQQPAFVSTGGYVPTFGAVPSLTEQFDPSRREDEEGDRR